MVWTLNLNTGLGHLKSQDAFLSAYTQLQTNMLVVLFSFMPGFLFSCLFVKLSLSRQLVDPLVNPLIEKYVISHSQGFDLVTLKNNLLWTVVLHGYCYEVNCMHSHPSSLILPFKQLQFVLHFIKPSQFPLSISHLFNVSYMIYPYFSF